MIWLCWSDRTPTPPLKNFPVDEKFGVNENIPIGIVFGLSLDGYV
jgi:hypothetical protein